MRGALCLLYMPIVASQSIYCDWTSSLEWNRIGYDTSAKSQRECEELCDDMLLCTAVSYNSTLGCALLEEPSVRDGISYQCTKPMKIQKLVPAGFQPSCLELKSMNTTIDNALELNGTCYFSSQATYKVRYEELKGLHNHCGCFSGRRTAHLAHYLTTALHDELKSKGFYTKTGNATYMFGGFQDPPMNGSCDWNIVPPAGHCANWHWFDWQGKVVGDVSRDVFLPKEPDNRDGKEFVMGTRYNSLGLFDLNSFLDPFSYHLLCQFDV